MEKTTEAMKLSGVTDILNMVMHLVLCYLVVLD